MSIEIVPTGMEMSALEWWDDIAERIRDSEPVVFLDYDGTLAPLAQVPSQPMLSDSMRGTLGRLVKLCHVALVSGRDIKDLKRRVGLKGLIYLGSAGLEAAGPRGRQVQVREESIAASLDHAEKDLRYAIGDIRGALVERRKFSVAVHHMLVDEHTLPRLRTAFEDIASKHPELRAVRGKRAFELRAEREWDRGRAVKLVVGTLDLKNAMPVYIGDDRTDEAAFKVIGERGITILVSEDARETAAQYTLSDHEEVQQFLEQVIEVLEER